MALRIDKGSSKTKGLCKLSVTGDLTIYSIAELKQALSEALEQYQQFELNLAEVEEIDSSGIQLLLALSRELAGKQRGLKVSAISAGVEQLMMRYALVDRFNVGARA